VSRDSGARRVVQSVESTEPAVACFRCGRPAAGLTSFLVGTKEGVPVEEQDVAVCEDCYVVLKEKVRTRSRLQD
jgi:hypothetical protein